MATLLTATLIGGCTLHAKDKHPKAKPAEAQDQIIVESHISNDGGAITRFLATQHYSRSYIYAEREPGQPVTLIDVTNPSHPLVLSQATASSASINLLAVAGTAALSSDAPAPNTSALQTIRIIDFSDPANPKMTKQFDNVTAVQTISGGVILLANSDGIWILSRHLAADPAAEERYARKVVYGESMY